MTKTLIRILVGSLFVGGLALPAGGEVLGDIQFERAGGGEGFAVAYFPHWVHRMQFKCYVCHDAIFKMKKGATPMTMDDMMQGKSCGTCHNGEIAWNIGGDTCNLCHVGD